MRGQPRLVLRFDIEGRHLERLRREFPGADFTVAATPEALSGVLGEAAALIGGDPVSAEELAAAPKLRWIQATSAGVEEFLTAALRERSIALTNFSGVNAPPIADHVLAMLLAFARGLKPLLARQNERAWSAGEAGAPATFEPAGQTVGVVGLGDIGEAVAARAHGLGMRVLGLERHPPAEPPPGVERVLASDQLPDLLAASDHVVLCLPLTDATEHLIGREELRRMRRSAYLYNVGRGGLIDQEALVGALRAGAIAGAGLDVVEPEPLPPDSPLWDLPNVIITAHAAGNSPRNWERGIELLADNVRRFLAGQPLRNEVDSRAGY
jgi:phosphoglycerate dehydrogenase-like enzyme